MGLARPLVFGELVKANIVLKVAGEGNSCRAWRMTLAGEFAVDSDAYGKPLDRKAPNLVYPRAGIILTRAMSTCSSWGQGNNTVHWPVSTWRMLLQSQAIDSGRVSVDIGPGLQKSTAGRVHLQYGYVLT